MNDSNDSFFKETMAQAARLKELSRRNVCEGWKDLRAAANKLEYFATSFTNIANLAAVELSLKQSNHTASEMAREAVELRKAYDDSICKIKKLTGALNICEQKADEILEHTTGGDRTRKLALEIRNASVEHDL